MDIYTNKKEWKHIEEIRIEVVEDDGSSYNFPIKCPRWLFNILERLEKMSNN